MRMRMNCLEQLTDEQFAALSDVTYDKVSRNPPDYPYEWNRNRLTSSIHANGWRIVAVCPQPDQRRPDYVLGRSKGVA